MTLLGKKLPSRQWTAMWIFLGVVIVVALLGAFSELRPMVGKKHLSMTLVIQMFMLCAGALICMITKTPPKSVGGTSVFRSGMVAVVCVFGVAWLSDTIFKAHLNELKEVLVEYVKLYPWAYAVVLLLVSSSLTLRLLLSLSWFRLLSASVLRPVWLSAAAPLATATTSSRHIRLTWLPSSSTAPVQLTLVSS